MEDNYYSALTNPMNYLQHWYQTPHVQPLQTPDWQQMVNAGHSLENPTENRVMAELAVHQDPYSFEPPVYQEVMGFQDTAVPTSVQTPPKAKRGRPPNKPGSTSTESHQEKVDEALKKTKRKVDRFNGMSEAEVMAKTLPDVLTYNLDILIIGINPGLMSAYIGHHYPNPGNHFWKCLFLSGLTEDQLNYMHDQTLPEKYGIGFTNMVERTTPGSKDLTSKEFREGGRLLVEKLQKYKPLIAVFNGKCIYEIFSKEIFGIKTKNLEFGLQPHKVPGTQTVCYLMPSSSARCAQFPRAQDKVHFYIKLKELRDQLRGVVQNHEVQETNYVFNLQLAKEDAKKITIKEEQYDPSYEAVAGTYEGAPGSSRCNFNPTAAGPEGTVAPSIHIRTSAVADQSVASAWTTQPFPDHMAERQYHC